MKKIIRMFLLSIFLAFLLSITICFEDFKIRMGIIILKFGGDCNENKNGKNGE